MNVSTLSFVENIRKDAHPVNGASSDYDPLLARIGNSRFVLIGEASHGTHEFYQQRAEITKRLIAEKQFTAVAVEADWPDAYRIDRFVRGYPGDGEASEALSDFKRFPTWMWRNADVLDFIGWLRQYNDELPRGKYKAGFYGLDLLQKSIQKQVDAPATVMPASNILLKTPNDTDTPRGSEQLSPVKMPW